MSATATVRRFNRFYTGRIGVLGESLAGTAFNLTESRLLWEFAHRESATAAELARDLGLDPGYLSRLLAGFRARKLVRAERSAEDARRWRLSLTAAGRRAFAPLDQRSEAAASALLAPLPPADRSRVAEAMVAIESLLGGDSRAPVSATAPAGPPTWQLRPLASGDLGWVVGRHGSLYASEYGWGLRFEAMVARIAADFVDRFEPEREACWIAERAGTRLGCVFLIQERDSAGEVVAGTARLRMLVVEPSARGAGIGAGFVAACEAFARQKGYRRIVLGTHSVLLAARALYARAGYRLTHSEPHAGFGATLVGETWALELDPPSPG